MVEGTRMPRNVWLATGGAWGLTSALLLAGPVASNPGTVLDWAALLAYTAAWLLFAPAIVLMSRIVPGRGPRLVGLAVAVAAVATAVANVAEIGLKLGAASSMYVTGILLATALLVPLSYLFARGRANRLSLLTIVLFLGLGFTSGGIGGALVLIAFVALALRTDAFQPHRPTPPPELELVPGRS